MITIKKEIYNKIIQMKHEECGFLLGRRKNFTKLYKCRNLAKEDNRFEISLFNLIIVFLVVIFKHYDSVCLFHVHDKTSALSRHDLENMMKEFIYGIVIKEGIAFYMICNGNIIKVESEVV